MECPRCKKKYNIFKSNFNRRITNYKGDTIGFDPKYHCLNCGCRWDVNIQNRV